MYKLLQNLEDKFRLRCDTVSDINQHLEVLREYAAKCDHVTEVRSRWSDATWALLAAKPDVMVTYDFLDPSLFNINLDEVKLTASSICLDYTHKVTNTSQPQDIDATDLIFIDTEHTFKGAIIDLMHYERYVRKYMILAKTEVYAYIDEVLTDTERLGMMTAIEEFLSRYPTWRVKEFRRNNFGMTILERINENI